MAETGRLPADAVMQYLLNATSNDLTVNGSVTPVEFSYTVPSGKRFIFQRLMLYIDDATGFASAEFGALGAALTNGVDISAAGTIIENWKDNVDIVSSMFDFVGYANFGKATNSGAGRWTMAKSFGQSLQLGAGETIVAKVQDDLTGLVTFRIKVQGYLIEI